jgi:hypothetical protein
VTDSNSFSRRFSGGRPAATNGLPTDKNQPTQTKTESQKESPSTAPTPPPQTAVSEGWSWAAVGQIASIVSGVLVAIFTGALVCTSLKQWHVANDNLIETKKAANAARDAAAASKASARAADASLHVYRPFLIVESVSMPPNLNSSTLPVSFRINIRNAGIGPADLRQVHMEGQVFPWNGRGEPIPDYETNGGWTPIESILGAGQESTLPGAFVPRWFDITPDEFREMRAGTKCLGLHGIIYYRGGPEKEYLTRFFWWYLIDGAGTTQPDIVRANRP